MRSFFRKTATHTRFISPRCATSAQLLYCRPLAVEFTNSDGVIALALASQKGRPNRL
jgi:hypothetical protein